jgi:hypothetical protein
MADDLNNDNGSGENNTGKDDDKNLQQNDANKGDKKDGTPEIDTIVEARLKPIKEKLDAAFSERDKALERLRVLEKAERDAQLKRLEDDGKHREAYEIRLKEEREAREAAEARAVELTRDVQLKGILGNYKFRSEKASGMAYDEIVKDLVKDAKGTWVHKSGATMAEFVEAYGQNESNAFLFEPKVSKGSGGRGFKSASDTGAKPTSLFNVSQDDVIKMAAEGKLPHQQRR